MASDEHDVIDALATARIVEAADAYVSARYWLRGASAADALEASVLVDECWHELTVALGRHDPECEDCELALDERRDYASGRRIVTEKGL